MRWKVVLPHVICRSRILLFNLCWESNIQMPTACLLPAVFAAMAAAMAAPAWAGTHRVAWRYHHCIPPLSSPPSSSPPSYLGSFHLPPAIILSVVVDLSLHWATFGVLLASPEFEAGYACTSTGRMTTAEEFTVSNRKKWLLETTALLPLGIFPVLYLGSYISSETHD